MSNEPGIDAQQFLPLRGSKVEASCGNRIVVNNLKDIASCESKLVINFELKSYDDCETAIEINIGANETKISMYGDAIHNGETHFYIKAAMDDVDYFVSALSDTINGHAPR